MQSTTGCRLIGSWQWFHIHSLPHDRKKVQKSSTPEMVEESAESWSAGPLGSSVTCPESSGIPRQEGTIREVPRQADLSESRPAGPGSRCRACRPQGGADGIRHPRGNRQCRYCIVEPFPNHIHFPRLCGREQSVTQYCFQNCRQVAQSSCEGRSCGKS